MIFNALLKTFMAVSSFATKHRRSKASSKEETTKQAPPSPAAQASKLGVQEKVPPSNEADSPSMQSPTCYNIATPLGEHESCAPVLEWKHFEHVHTSRKTLGYYRPVVKTPEGMKLLEIGRRENNVLLAIAHSAYLLDIPFYQALTANNGELFIRYWIMLYGQSEDRASIRQRYTNTICKKQGHRQPYIAQYLSELKRIITQFATNNHVDIIPLVPQTPKSSIGGDRKLLQIPSVFKAAFFAGY